ncbi:MULTISPECIES: SHOCT domain-containing protein [unclassified Leucobacter]|uniref:SHOCT domain-containing protein n=1 Tax=unclassified Leucobacter TaxID=2621730 RepID=UPI00165DAFCE|nr:PLDc_N domain-containing protein [Leucobacter sp. cx-87]
MSFWESLWNIITVFFVAFFFIAALFALIVIVMDLVRDKQLNGWWKALWLVFLIFVPFITALVYLIARGEGMATRTEREARSNEQAATEYIRTLAGAGPADEISKAKALLDSGTITADEFTAIKENALRM